MGYSKHAHLLGKATSFVTVALNPLETRVVLAAMHLSGHDREKARHGTSLCAHDCCR